MWKYRVILTAITVLFSCRLLRCRTGRDCVPGRGDQHAAFGVAGQSQRRHALGLVDPRAGHREETLRRRGSGFARGENVQVANEVLVVTPLTFQWGDSALARDHYNGGIQVRLLADRLEVQTCPACENQCVVGEHFLDED